MSPGAQPALTAGVRVKADHLSGKTMLLYPEGMLELNPTGAEIVALCDGQRTFGEIVATLAAKFAAPPDVLGKDVGEYLERLLQKGLVKAGEPG